MDFQQSTPEPILVDDRTLGTTLVTEPHTSGTQLDTSGTPTSTTSPVTPKDSCSTSSPSSVTSSPSSETSTNENMVNLRLKCLTKCSTTEHTNDTQLLVKRFPSLGPSQPQDGDVKETFDGEFQSLIDQNIGSKQSPIDLNTSSDTTTLDTSMTVSFTKDDVSATITNTGRTVQVNWANAATLQVDGQTFDLVQFHYHWPSEHTIQGNQYPLEVHFVFSNRDDTFERTPSQAGLAVLGVMYELGEEDNAFIAQFIGSVPEIAQVTSEIVHMNGQALEPVFVRDHVMTYSGSLTTPPFSEGVKWFVSGQVQTISGKQFEMLVKESISQSNNRALQEKNGRNVSFCGMIGSCCGH